MVTDTVVFVQSLSHVQLFVTPWTAACQTSLSFAVSQSLLQLMSTESVMSSNHLILWCPLLLLPSIFPSIRVFSNLGLLHCRQILYHLSHQGSPLEKIDSKLDFSSVQFSSVQSLSHV